MTGHVGLRWRYGSWWRFLCLHSFLWGSLLWVGCSAGGPTTPSQEPTEKREGQDAGPLVGNQGEADASEKFAPPEGEGKSEPNGLDDGKNMGSSPDAVLQRPPRSFDARQLRRCPSEFVPGGAARFERGKVCASDSSAADCARGSCVPVRSLTPPKSSAFSKCSDPSVLCVGASHPTQTLKEAAALFVRDKKIQTLAIESGLYKESVLFAEKGRSLRIVGASNDPTNGTRLVAPPSSGAAATYSALRFVGMKSVRVASLVVTGGGHGVSVVDSESIQMEGVRFLKNRYHGAFVRRCKTVLVRSSSFHTNGLEQVLLGTGLIAVNINNTHQPVNPQGQIAVNINNTHRPVDPNNSIAVNINNTHRPIAQFGLAIERVPDVRLEQNEFAYNKSGGLLVSGGSLSEVAVNINNTHRVLGGSEVAVNINNTHRVVMRANWIHHNGPIGIPVKNLSKGCIRCQNPNIICQSSGCFPRLSVAAPSGSKSTQAWIGLGAAIIGVGKVELVGNTFFRNEASGLWLHSVGEGSLSQNVWERNGVRLGAKNSELLAFPSPALRVWNVRTSFTFDNNMLIDNVVTGASFAQSLGGSWKLRARANHIAGNGRFLPEANLSRGNGLHLQGGREGATIRFELQKNFFAGNRRASFAAEGSLSGLLRHNGFLKQTNRGLTFQNVGTDATQVIRLEENTLLDGRGYGIQIHRGQASFVLVGNVVERVRSIPSNSPGLGEADLLNVLGLQGELTVVDNLFLDAGRAGVLLDSSSGALANNQITGGPFQVVLQNGASLRNNSQANLPPRKRSYRSDSSSSAPRPKERLSCRSEF